MIDEKAVRDYCATFGCDADIEPNTVDQKTYMVILKCPDPDYENIRDLEREIRSKFPSIVRVTLDVTPRKQ